MKKALQKDEVKIVFDEAVIREYPEVAKHLEGLQQSGKPPEDIERFKRDLLVHLESSREYWKMHSSETEGASETEGVSEIEIAKYLLKTVLVTLSRSGGASRTVKIARPPGTGLRAMSDFLFSKKTMDRIVLPLIADLQEEYAEALNEGRTLKAYWIRVRYMFTYFNALGFKRFLGWVVGLFTPSSAG